MNEEGWAALGWFLILILVAIAIGPWVILVIAEWVLSPRIGSWAGWAHGVGAAWCLLVVGIFLTRRIRG